LVVALADANATGCATFRHFVRAVLRGSAVYLQVFL
jgi:hypothetical protein